MSEIVSGGTSDEEAIDVDDAGADEVVEGGVDEVVVGATDEVVGGTQVVVGVVASKVYKVACQQGLGESTTEGRASSHVVVGGGGGGAWVVGSGCRVVVTAGGV